MALNIGDTVPDNMVFTESLATATPVIKNGVNFYPITLTVTANVDGVEQSASRLLYLHKCESTDEHQLINSLDETDPEADIVYFLQDN